MKLQKRNQRGAAMVELAISMLLIIPVFLYVLFLDDLLKFRLEQQEAVVTTLWDYTTWDYDNAVATEATGWNPQGNQTVVQKYSRNTYCDHQGALDSKDKTANGSGSGEYLDCAENAGTSADHHRGELSSHACWLGQGQPPTCTQPDKTVGVVTGLGALGATPTGYAQQFQQGGYWECDAKLVVTNNLIPQGFLQNMSKQDLAKKNWQGKDGASAHSNGKSAQEANAYSFVPTKFALLTDTWALHEVQNTATETYSGKLWDRTNYIFTKNNLYFPYMGLSYAMMAKAASEQLYIPYLSFDINHLIKPSVSIQPKLAPTRSVPNESGNVNHYDSPWKDWAQNPVEKTYNARGKGYMGCKTPGQNC